MISLKEHGLYKVLMAMMLVLNLGISCLLLLKLEATTHELRQADQLLGKAVKEVDLSAKALRQAGGSMLSDIGKLRSDFENNVKQVTYSLKAMESTLKIFDVTLKRFNEIEVEQVKAMHELAARIDPGSVQLMKDATESVRKKFEEVGRRLREDEIRK